jgi:hypothetical protein
VNGAEPAAGIGIVRIHQGSISILINSKPGLIDKDADRMPTALFPIPNHTNKHPPQKDNMLKLTYPVPLKRTEIP